MIHIGRRTSSYLSYTFNVTQPISENETFPMQRQRLNRIQGYFFETIESLLFLQQSIVIIWLGNLMDISFRSTNLSKSDEVCMRQ